MRRVAGMAERVIRRDEIPGLSARPRDGVAGQFRQGIGVIVEVKADRRTGFAGEIRRSRPADDENPVLLPRDFKDRKSSRGGRATGDHVDAFIVKPFARLLRGDIRLVLMVGGNDLDLLGKNFVAEILRRQPRRRNRTTAAIVGKNAGLIVEHADLDDVIRAPSGSCLHDE
jgi:hypothetical protein